MEYDSGKETSTGFERKGLLCPSSREWRSAITHIRCDHQTRLNRIGEYLSEMLQKYPQLAEYQRPPPEKDILFQSNYPHHQTETRCTVFNRAKTKASRRTSCILRFDCIWGSSDERYYRTR